MMIHVKHPLQRAHMIQDAIPGDFDAWLTLAREVEYLFGPMCDVPEFQNALKSAIAESHAFCVKDVRGGSQTFIEGGILISRSPNAIAWFAVSKSSRGRGIGSSLLSHALSCFPGRDPVYVQTFAPGCKEGMPARHLYQKAGFIDLEPRELTPAGVPTVLMVKSG